VYGKSGGPPKTMYSMGVHISMNGGNFGVDIGRPTVTRGGFEAQLQC